jgi:hypothetical protein
MDLNKLREKGINIKDELLKIKITPEQLKERLAIFYDAYNTDMPIAIKKYNQAIELKHYENATHIQEFINDLKYAKIMIDNLAEPYTNMRLSKWQIIKKKAMLPFQIKKFSLLLKHSASMMTKYKKEDSDIKNFDV